MSIGFAYSYHTFKVSPFITYTSSHHHSITIACVYIQHNQHHMNMLQQVMNELEQELKHDATEPHFLKPNRRNHTLKRALLMHEYTSHNLH